jgi:hypothetical protein
MLSKFKSLILLTIPAIGFCAVNTACIGQTNTWNILVYMCGSSLEGSYGLASRAFTEFQTASLKNNINIYIETGGALN